LGAVQKNICRRCTRRPKTKTANTTFIDIFFRSQLVIQLIFSYLDTKNTNKGCFSKEGRGWRKWRPPAPGNGFEENAIERSQERSKARWPEPLATNWPCPGSRLHEKWKGGRERRSATRNPNRIFRPRQDVASGAQRQGFASKALMVSLQEKTLQNPKPNSPTPMKAQPKPEEGGPAGEDPRLSRPILPGTRPLGHRGPPRLKKHQSDKR